MGPVLPAADLALRLRAGGAALFPTDTLPALAATPAAAADLWRLKRRPADKPLILMGADLEQLLCWLADDWPADAPRDWLEQARLCWPGAVTLVLPIRGPSTDLLHPGGGSLGLRIPDCGMARDLLRITGPLATTSANRSGETAARNAAEAAAIFPDLPLLAPLPWPEGSGLASAVLAWETAGDSAGRPAWTMLRSGASGPPAQASSNQAPGTSAAEPL